jgi:hypothetical protein
MGAVFEKKMVPFLFSAKGVQSMNQNTKPTERKGTGTTSLPKRYGVSLPQDLSRCDGCPYPQVGFICWSPDGTCMKSDVDAINRRSKGR